MPKAILLAPAMALAVLFGSTAAQAVTLTLDSDEWLANAGGPVNFTTSYGTAELFTNFVVLEGGGSFTTDPQVQIKQIPTSWGTWSGGYTGQVLFTSYTGDINNPTFINQVTLTLTGVDAFGLEVQPNLFDYVMISVVLDGNPSLTNSQVVYGDGGAAFFGYFGGGVSQLSISAPTGQNFAFGNFSSVAVPLPAALPLFATAIGAFAAAGHWRRRQRSKQATAA